MDDFNNVVILLCCACSVYVGGLKPHGQWNRPFSLSPSMPLDEYVQLIAWKINNETSKSGLGLVLPDFAFNIDTTMLGVTLKGSVTFEKGVIVTAGDLVPGLYVQYNNMTQDATSAALFLNWRMITLNLLHDLRTDMNQNVVGSIPTDMSNVHFFMMLNHTFSTNTTVVTSDYLGIESVSWTIKPRDINTYIIEETTNRNERTEWYRNPLNDWQEQVLLPFVAQVANGLPFPVSPYA